MLLNVDGADGEQWEPGGTIVVPVEWRPGKDGAPGAPGEKGNDWISPHNEWEWNANTPYTQLAMVRASTGEFDPWGNEIFWYYITQGWVKAGDDAPKDNPYWQLLSKDWMAGDGNLWSTTVLLGQDQNEESWTFDSQGNGTPTQVRFTSLSGNPAMATWDGSWITILKTWHYRIFWHLIVQNNHRWTNFLINLWRMWIHLAPGEWSGRSPLWIGTWKSWGSYATKQWPWLDLDVDIQLDLYEWDRLTMYYRAQTDTDWSSWQVCEFAFKGSLDPSGSVQSWYLWWLFSTYLWVEWISKKTWQTGTSWKYVQSI
jgi:hypothetical protein